MREPIGIMATDLQIYVIEHWPDNKGYEYWPDTGRLVIHMPDGSDLEESIDDSKLIAQVQGAITFLVQVADLAIRQGDMSSLTFSLGGDTVNIHEASHILWWKDMELRVTVELPAEKVVIA